MVVGPVAVHARRLGPLHDLEILLPFDRLAEDADTESDAVRPVGHPRVNVSRRQRVGARHWSLVFRLLSFDLRGIVPTSSLNPSPSTRLAASRSRIREGWVR